MELTEPIPAQIYADTETTELLIGPGVDLADPRVAAFNEQHRSDGRILAVSIGDGPVTERLAWRVNPAGADRDAISQVVAHCFPGAAPEQCAVLVLMPVDFQDSRNWTFLVTYQGQTLQTVLPGDPPTHGQIMRLSD